MKFLTLLALISQSNAVEVVGGITKEIACKDAVEVASGKSTGVVADCTVKDYTVDPFECSVAKPLTVDNLGVITAADWADTTDQCAKLFDTDAGDFKCVYMKKID